jgi:hypothetical protein
MSHVSLYCPKTNIELPEKCQGKTWAEQAKFLTELAIPFISLCKPAAGALSLGMGTWNVAQYGALMIWGKPENRGVHALALARGVALLGATYFQHKALVIASSLSDLIHNLSLLYQAPPENRGEPFGRCLLAALHLLTALQPCSLQWQMASLVVQALFEFYQAFQVEKKPTDLGYERALTMTAKVAMGGIRLYQAGLFLEEIQRQHDAKNREAPKKLKADEEAAREKNRSLSNLREQIEQKRVVLQDPIKGEKYDFGAFFHGYGKGMVRGDILRFQTKTAEDGTTWTQLAFKINQFHFAKLKTFLKSQGSFPHCQSGIRNIPCQDLLTNRKCKIELSDLDEINGIKISLEGHQEIDAFQRALPSLGLDQAVEPSSPEDLQKTKLLFLLENFYPQTADKLRKEEDCFAFSLEELRQKIIATAPPMKNLLDHYTVQEQEIFPGCVRLSIPIEKEVYALGGRALTAIMVEDDFKDDKEFSVTLPSEEVHAVANIVKNGLLSQEQRAESGLKREGYSDGNPEVNFTQMIWERDVKNRTEIDSLGYSESGEVRFYFSLSALNRGSYQYNRDFDGVNKGKVYENRKNIFDFMENFPFRRKEAVRAHEFMLADRILPEEIQGMSVPSKKVKEQIVECFRTGGLIQTDNLGQELINGIPVDQFLSTEERLPLNIIDRCHTQGEHLAVQDPSDPHFQFFRQILGQLAAGLSIPDEYVKR